MTKYLKYKYWGPPYTVENIFDGKDNFSFKYGFVLFCVKKSTLHRTPTVVIKTNFNFFRVSQSTLHRQKKYPDVRVHWLKNNCLSVLFLWVLCASCVLVSRLTPPAQLNRIYSFLCWWTQGLAWALSYIYSLISAAIHFVVSLGITSSLVFSSLPFLLLLFCFDLSFLDLSCLCLE
jgi:hypothetical protein